MSELYDLSLDELLKGDATLLHKIERDMKVAKAENNVIKSHRYRNCGILCLCEMKETYKSIFGGVGECNMNVK